MLNYKWLKVKNLWIEENDRSDDWEGVSILCQALDTAFKYESESLVAGKSILEVVLRFF